MQWRLLDLPPLTAAENMALDEVLLEIRGSGRSQDTLRFLQFKPATVLVGFHQSIQEEIRLSYCREQGIDINRRITGGGGLLFDESQIGWELICDKAFFGVGIPNANLFRRLCEPTVTALRGMGIDAAFRPRNDIEVAGRKISGTGGTDCDAAFLFQGTLLGNFFQHLNDGRLPTRYRSPTGARCGGVQFVPRCVPCFCFLEAIIST